MSSGKPVVLVAVIALGFFLMTLSYRWYCQNWKVYLGYDPLPFSRSSWAAGTPETRGYMLAEFRSKYTLKGMSVAEVTELLGEPNYIYTNEQTGAATLLTYDLGYMGFNSNAPMVFSYDLRISVDNQGIVGDAYVDD